MNIMEARDHMIKAVHAWKDAPSSDNWQACIEGMDRIGEVASEGLEQKYKESASDLMAEILELRLCVWSYEQKSEFTIQLEALIRAIRESDQIDNPGYRQASFYAILDAFIGYIQDMMIRWYKKI